MTKPRSTERGVIPATPFIYVEGLASAACLLAEVDHTPTPVARLTLDGTIKRVVGWIPADETHVRTPRGGVVPLPFPNRAFSESSPDASRLAFAVASLEGDDAATFQVTVLDAADGDTVFALRLAFDPEPIPSAVKDSVKRRLRHRNLTIPPIYPPIAGLLVGRDHTIWVEMRAESGRPYVVLSPDGNLLGSLTLPRTSHVAVAQRNRIWVVERDADDVESIVRYGVAWRRTGRRGS